MYLQILVNNCISFSGFWIAFICSFSFSFALNRALSHIFVFATFLFDFSLSFNLKPRNSLYFLFRFVTPVFSSDTSNFNLWFNHCVVANFILFASLLVLQNILKSSAYLTIYISLRFVVLKSLYSCDKSLTPDFLICTCGGFFITFHCKCHCEAIHQSNSFKTIFANSGDNIPPCGVPFCGCSTVPSGNKIGAFSICFITWISFVSVMPKVHSCLSNFRWLTLSKKPFISTSTTYCICDLCISLTLSAIAFSALRFGLNP